jgi:hypothetical protein
MSDIILCEDSEIQDVAVVLNERTGSPVASAEVCGHAMGMNSQYLDKFCKSFTESLFSDMNICDRIDWFYQSDGNLSPRAPDVYSMVKWGMDSDVFYIEDTDDRFKGLKLALLRETEGDICSYAIRWYGNALPYIFDDPQPSFEEVRGVTTKQDSREMCHVLTDCRDVFWNFRRCGCGCGVRVLYLNKALFNPHLTRLAANFIRWTANALGYGRQCKKAKKAP